MCQRRISHGTCFEGGIRRKIKEEGEVRDEEERQVGTHIITAWHFPLFSLTIGTFKVETETDGCGSAPGPRARRGPAHVLRARDDDDVYRTPAFTLLAPRYIQAGMDALSIRNTTITSFASTHMQLSENDERVVVCGGRRAV